MTSDLRSSETKEDSKKRGEDAVWHLPHGKNCVSSFKSLTDDGARWQLLVGFDECQIAVVVLSRKDHPLRDDAT